jgi:hypothetical protein
MFGTLTLRVCFPLATYLPHIAGCVAASMTSGELRTCSRVGNSYSCMGLLGWQLCMLQVCTQACAQELECCLSLICRPYCKGGCSHELWLTGNDTPVLHVTLSADGSSRMNWSGCSLKPLLPFMSLLAAAYFGFTDADITIMIDTDPQ